MKYLNTYKIFESSDNDEETAELIEECKDIIETFNEAEDKFKIIKYESGFIHNNFFSQQHHHESDTVAIKFYLLSSSNLSDDISGGEDTITIEKADDIIALVNKSKLLIKRLSRYCEKIYYGITQKSIKFTLEFTNPDRINSKSIKINRLYKKIKEGTVYFSKDLNLVNMPSFGTLRFTERYKNFYELIKNNPNLIDSYGKWDDTRDRTELTIRFDQKESIDGDSIIIDISRFKYKTYHTRFKNIKLSDKEREEAMKCIEHDILSHLREDKDSVESSIDGYKIKIKVK